MVKSIIPGLYIEEEDFMALPNKQQMCTLFQNQIKQFEKLDSIEKLVGGYRFHQKIQYVWLTVITSVGVGLISKYGSLIFPSLFILLLIH